MIKIWSVLSILIIISSPIYSQQKEKRLESISKKIQSFDYQAVIKIADSLLLNAENLKNSDKIEINRLKGISHFSLLQMRLALNSFINILKLNPNYKMNPIRNSPKIVKYFNAIKENFKNSVFNVKENDDEFSSLLINRRTEIKTAIGYSLLLPGFGHIQHGKTTQGWSLMSAAIITLGASIYFIVDSDQKENEYLNESGKLLIENKYNKYNDAYKLRNISLLSFATVWIYAQLDLLVFDSDKSKKISLHSLIDFNSPTQLELQIRF